MPQHDLKTNVNLGVADLLREMGRLKKEIADYAPETDGAQTLYRDIAAVEAGAQAYEIVRDLARIELHKGNPAPLVTLVDAARRLIDQDREPRS